MAYEKKPNEGALFKNKERRDERDAHARGDAIVACPKCGKETSYWLNAYTNESKAGEKWQKIKLKAKEPKQAPPQEADPVDDSEVPF